MRTGPFMCEHCVSGKYPGTDDKCRECGGSGMARCANCGPLFRAHHEKKSGEKVCTACHRADQEAA